MLQFNFTEAIKVFFMVADVRLVSLDADETNSGWNGEVPVFDMNGFGLRHVCSVVLSVLRIYMKYTQVNLMTMPNLDIILKLFISKKKFLFRRKHIQFVYAKFM